MSLARNLAPEFWNDRSFVDRWFTAGLPFVDEVFPSTWKSDQELFLLLAKHCRDGDLRETSFRSASPTLRGDKAFMKRIIVLAPSLFCCATGSLVGDYDLALISFADSELVVEDYLLSGGSSDAVHAFLSTAMADMETYSTFCSTVVFGMSRHVDSGSTLSLLVQDTETSDCFKKQIAGYLGVPTGKKLRLLRRACAHICLRTFANPGLFYDA